MVWIQIVEVYGHLFITSWPEWLSIYSTSVGMISCLWIPAQWLDPAGTFHHDSLWSVVQQTRLDKTDAGNNDIQALNTISYHLFTDSDMGIYPHAAWQY